MKQLREELEEELRQEKLAAGIRPGLISELYMPIPPPLSEREKQLRKENAERADWEMRWLKADRKAAEEAKRAAAEVAETAAQYLP